MSQIHGPIVQNFYISRFYSSNISSSSAVPGLKIKDVGNISRIEFDRPEKFNAITWEMYHGMIRALNDANENKTTRITLFTGIFFNYY